MNRSKLPILAATLLGLGAASAFAAGDDTVKARQECMKMQGKTVFGMFFPMLKGERTYDATAIKAGMDAMNAACADWANFWTEDSMTSTTMTTKARPEIWSDKAGFEAVSDASYQAMTALGAAADEASFKAAMPAVGKACQDCHEKFRLPLQ